MSRSDTSKPFKPPLPLIRHLCDRNLTCMRLHPSSRPTRHGTRVTSTHHFNVFDAIHSLRNRQSHLTDIEPVFLQVMSKLDVFVLNTILVQPGDEKKSDNPTQGCKS